MTRTTFSTLTDLAGAQLDTAAGLLADAQVPAPGAAWSGAALTEAMSAHADLSCALVDLGRTLRGPSATTRASGDARLLAALDARGRRTPWPEPGETEVVPAEPGVGHAAAGHIRSAARCIRAAADLWATHRGHTGAPRSPEAARLRHPSVLGAALRHWRALIARTSTIAEALQILAHGQGLAPHLLDSVCDYPAPAARVERLPPVAVPLARPAPRTLVDPLTEIADRIDRIHRHVWALDRDDRVSALALVNLAAIGMLLARSASHAHQAARPDARRTADRVRLDAGRATAESQLEAWSGVAAQAGPLRSADGPSILQVERLDLARLAERALRTPDCTADEPTNPSAGSPRAAVAPLGRTDAPAGQLAHQLLDACEDFAHVAVPCARSVRRMHRNGRLLMAGRAVPRDLLARRPDLLAARLADRVVPAPTAVVRRLEAQLGAVAALGPGSRRAPAA